MQPAFLNGLNPEQLAAVTLPPQSALILAGAGCGKTRVLTTRIAWLIADRPGEPGGVLAVTFTNKAAKEMLTRLSAMLPINTRGMWIGTFHGLCNRMLRAHYREAGAAAALPDPRHAGPARAVKRVIKAMNLDEERYPPRQLQWFIAGAKEEGLRAERRRGRRRVHAPAWSSIYAAYDEQCQREGVVDFAELLLRSYELLRATSRCASTTSGASATSWSTSSRTPTAAVPLAASCSPGRDTRGVRGRRRRPVIYAFRGAQVANMAALRARFPRRDA